jgi:protein-S-isoprenylcysteine O-methyltransferase Ste14
MNAVLKKGLRLDLLWALATLYWALDALARMLLHPHLQPLLYFCLHLAAAILFLVRWEIKERSSAALGYVIAGLSAVHVYFYRFDAPHGHALARSGELVTVLGVVLCILATVSLGRCFAVFPAYRGVKVGGLYRLIRHPIYLSYMLMDLGIMFSSPSLFNGTIFLGAIGLFLWRISYEERLLERSVAYRTYQAQVRYRLVPFVY